MSKVNLIQRISLQLGKWLNSYRYIRQQLKNQRLGRQLVGTDRDGNKYYQYYSYYGLPTRRQVNFADPQIIVLNDLVYYRWLYKFDLDPPTQLQKEEFYLEETLRKKRALEWDRKEKELIDGFNRQREQLLLRNQALKQLKQEQDREKQESLSLKTKREN